LLARPVEVRPPRRATDATLQIAVPAAALARVDPASIRMFRLEPATRTWQIVPRSGFAPAGGYAWARPHRAGVYAPVGLPLDRTELTDLVQTFNARAELREQRRLPHEGSGRLLRRLRQRRVERAMDVSAFEAAQRTDPPKGFLDRPATRKAHFRACARRRLVTPIRHTAVLPLAAPQS
jgi:hypothetical protein